MLLQGILHVPLSNYAYAENEETLTIRLRTAKDDVTDVTILYGDRVCMQEPIITSEIKMKKVATDQLFDYYQGTIHKCYRRVCYYFSIKDKEEELFYDENGFCKVMKDHRTQYFQFPYLRREDVIKVPEWAKEIVMYHIFPDSFATGKESLVEEKKDIPLENGLHSINRLGGTLKGVKENLDYISQLGCNCIYLNPIFLAGQYHKYDTIDYFHIDPCFGTDEDFKELVKECHKRGMRIILDGVFNHCGWNFFAFEDVKKSGEQSMYKDWFYDLKFPLQYDPLPNYEAFAYVKEMPKLNTSNPEVMDYFCKVGEYWIKEMDIDGWRLDVANEINHDFWRSFRKRVKAIKKDAFLIAEIWEDSTAWLNGDQFDSTMNYTFSYLCRDYFAEHKFGVKEFDERLHHMLMRYPENVDQVQMNLLDSHDVPRFYTYCNEEESKLNLALRFLFSFVGIPSVFYGDEKLISGVKEYDYRSPMNWKKDNANQEDINQTSAICHDWIALRKKYKAMTQGSFTTVTVDEENEIYAFMRSYENERVLICFHNENSTVKYSIPEQYQGRLINAFTGQPVQNNSCSLQGMDAVAFLVK